MNMRFHIRKAMLDKSDRLTIFISKEMGLNFSLSDDTAFSKQAGIYAAIMR